MPLLVLKPPLPLYPLISWETLLPASSLCPLFVILASLFRESQLNIQATASLSLGQHH